MTFPCRNTCGREVDHQKKYCDDCREVFLVCVCGRDFSVERARLSWRLKRTIHGRAYCSKPCSGRVFRALQMGFVSVTE